MKALLGGNNYTRFPFSVTAIYDQNSGGIDFSTLATKSLLLPDRQSYCANLQTVNTTIIFGMLLFCKVKANQMQDGTVTSFVACGFFLWFDLASDWSSLN